MSLVEKVNDHVWRICLRQPVPVEVYCYLTTGSKNTLVDCGHPSAVSQQDLLAAFEEIGITPSEIDQLILTHCHVDHIGSLVGENPMFANIPVLACHGAEQSVVGFDSFQSIRQNVPNDATFNLMVDASFIKTTEDYQLISRPLKITREVKHGDLIDLGGYEVRVLETPGLSASHISLLHEESGSLIGGDIVFSNGPPGLIVDLKQYVATLHMLRELDISLIYPGHGAIINHPNEAMDLALNRIRGMDESILDYIGQGAGTAFELALRFTKGEVNPRTRFFLGVVLVHLERLFKQGWIAMDNNEGSIGNIRRRNKS